MTDKKESNIGELESSLDELTKESKELEKATVCELKKSGRIDDEGAGEEEASDEAPLFEENNETDHEDGEDEIEIIEGKSEYRHDHNWTAKPRKKRKNWLLIFLNIFLVINAVLLLSFISAVCMEKDSDSPSIGKSPIRPDGNIVEYINEEKPVVSVNDIDVSVKDAEYEEGILTLAYTVTNNGNDTVRFLSNSFRIALDDERAVVPILAGNINENDTNTANGLEPGETVSFRLSYGIIPDEIEGKEIQLKGIFSSIDGTYDISYDVPQFNHQ